MNANVIMSAFYGRDSQAISAAMPSVSSWRMLLILSNFFIRICFVLRGGDKPMRPVLLELCALHQQFLHMDSL